ncbi:hypothetical protein H0H93_011654 [Arthromyces matolae]|nr:hypothetical protein H0H93_011654 [Arthromyces matolae]
MQTNNEALQLASASFVAITMEPLHLSTPVLLENVKSLQSVPPPATPLWTQTGLEPTGTIKILSTSSSFNCKNLSLTTTQLSNPSQTPKFTTAMAPHRKAIRPLPPIPPTSVSSSSSPVSLRTPRPLPTPPCNTPLSADLPKSESALSLITLAEALERHAHARRLYRYSSPSCDSTSTLPSPETPYSGQSSKLSVHRSPTHIKHPRFPVDELVLDDWAPPEPSIIKDSDQAEDDESGSIRSTSPAQIKNIFDDMSEVDDEEDNGERVIELKFQPPESNRDLNLGARISSHWLRESRGRRREESYQVVVNALRAL